MLELILEWTKFSGTRISMKTDFRDRNFNITIVIFYIYNFHCIADQKFGNNFQLHSYC